MEREFAPIAEALGAIEPPDPAWSARAAERQGRLTMPPGALGRLLEVGRQLAAIQRTDRPSGHPALVAVFAADHGIAEAGVSAYPQAVTGQMVANFLAGGAAVNVLARRVGAEVRVVDIGVRHLPEGLAGHPGLISRPIRPGTSNFLEGPAMTLGEAFRAIVVGLELADRWLGPGGEGFRVVALGEMGIGNTTTASALLAAITGAGAETVVGRGTGIDDDGVKRKVAVVERAVTLHAIDDPDSTRYSRLGGFEILGLAGLALGAARHRALVVLDGFISTVAALVASMIHPGVVDYCLAAHLGPEPGHRVALDHLRLKPLLELGFRLGEGTGAALALPTIAASADILRDMATFDSAAVSGPVDPRTGPI